MRLDAVRGRRVLVGEQVRPATLRLRDGRIEAIEPVGVPVAGEVLEVPPTAYVLPGAVDTHVHVNEPGRTEWEGFASATTAAALGGVTTLVDMPLNSLPPTTTVEHLEVKRRAAGELAVDVGFWGGAVPGNLADLGPLWDAGVFGFKCFLADSGVEEFPPLTPDELTAVLREVARLDALLVVHAEDAGVLARSARQSPSTAYADFLHSRPDEAETVAIRRVLDGARQTGARVHIVHLSSARALDLVGDARAEGSRVTVETCPHYLCFTAEQIPDAAPQFKCCPPIRDSGNREALWSGLREGIIDCVVSDHSPATAELKCRGDGDLMAAWGGISGLQVGFSAVASEALRRDVPLTAVSRWMSRATADLVGLAQKGRIEVGADADLAVFDPDAGSRVDAARLAHRNPISAYDGMRLDGRVTRTVLRGDLVDEERPDHRWGRRLRRTP
jgi:allantoinase